jgi:carbonic anhydrase/acetyltransferase-like protein (isoleucine patch superfamily)
LIASLGDRAPRISGVDTYVAHNATLIGDVVLEDQASVWFNAVLRGDNDTISIGACSNVQDAAVLHTDPGLKLSVGSGVTVGHQVMLHGCTIGDNSLIGIGTTILNGAVIGRNTVVGAGALITEGKSFPEGVLLIGAPARVARELEPEEIEKIGLSAEVYVRNARRFSAELKALSV